MAVKKSKKSSDNAEPGKKGKAKTEAKEPKLTRKGFVLGLVEKAGSKGISTASLIEKTDVQFAYGEDGSSRMRVNNTIKEATDKGIVAIEDGVVTWKG